MHLYTIPRLHQYGVYTVRIRPRNLWLLIIVLLLGGCSAAPRYALTLATTTSVGNSGLLDALRSEFQRDTRVDIRAHLVGSGRALAMLENGNADLAITHAPELEAKAMAEHPSWAYYKLMFNDFVIVGPAHDPARVAEGSTPVDAFRRIAHSGHRFISRGDSSGTHERENLLWGMAAVTPPPESIVVAGQGMGATLRIASETASYTLTDRATFAQHERALQITILFQGGPSLLNTYAVVVPARHGGALQFARWLTEGRGREVIGGYRTNGVAVFTPWPSGAPRGDPADLPR